MLRDVEVVGEVASAHDLALAPEADALLVDSDLLPAVLTEPMAWAAVVVVGADEDLVSRLRATDVPGWAALPDTADEQELSLALRLALAGFAILPRALAESVVTTSVVGVSLPGSAGMEPLTSRERDVLTLLATGLPNKSIAARLEISENTVKFHLGALYGKLGVSSRAAAVREGLRRGLLVV